MSLSKEERSKNLQLALGILLEAVGERQIREYFFHQTDALFSGVLSTTWKELEANGFIHEPTVMKGGPGVYLVTSRGWLAGTSLFWDQNKEEFDARLGRLGAALKNKVKGREGDELVSLNELAQECDVPKGWVFNAIDSDLYGHKLNRVGASWAHSHRGHYIDIPLDFGLERL